MKLDKELMIILNNNWPSRTYTKMR